MKIFVFGNGNLPFNDFLTHYVLPAERYVGCNICLPRVEFLLCDFRGVDTLMMEFLKTRTANVTVFHIGTDPRYFPSKFQTKAATWATVAGFENDKDRDAAAIERCTHFLAHDTNTDENRKSGTQKNIELCLELGKERIVGLLQQER
jgi:hypothetical protein